MNEERKAASPGSSEAASVLTASYAEVCACDLSLASNKFTIWIKYEGGSATSYPSMRVLFTCFEGDSASPRTYTTQVISGTSLLDEEYGLPDMATGGTSRAVVSWDVPAGAVAAIVQAKETGDGANPGTIAVRGADR